jgi:predicted ABC-type ATPase|tara:strand:- start:19925 stop:22342 length:2418 start_codon:yes stop_codon:yes gene_type:complete
MALEEVTAGLNEAQYVKEGPATEIISGVSGWPIIHKIADSGVSRFESEFVKTVARASDVNRAAIRAALKGKNRQKALQIAVDAWKTQSQAWKAMVTKELTSTVAKAATAVGKRVLTNPAAIRFDVTNPLATKWARSQAALLIDKIGENQVKTIRNIIAQGFEEQITPLAVQKRIVSEIGLQSRSQVALERFRQDLIAKKISPSTINKRVLSYRNKLLKRRARAIARTELMRASNMGQQLLWEESVAQGHLNPSAFEKVWITTPDDRLCPYCQAKNGQRVGIFDTFQNPIGNPEPQPPLHPMCRCSTALVKTGKRVDRIAIPNKTTPTVGVVRPPDTIDVHKIGVDKDGNPVFTVARAKLHNDIVEKILKGATPVENPEVVVLGGGPASGKTAAKNAARADFKNNAAAVDPDEIRTMLPEYAEMQAKGGEIRVMASTITHEEASYLAKRAMREGQAKKLNMIMDGTGDGGYESLAKKVKGYRARGATRVTANYVTADAEEAMRRMLSRAEKTGRYVPEEVLRATHKNVSQVVPEALENKLFDSFTLWDNSVTGQPAKIVSEWSKASGLVLKDEDLWRRFLAKGDVLHKFEGEKVDRLLWRKFLDDGVGERPWPLSDTDVRGFSRESVESARYKYGTYVEGLPKGTIKAIEQYTSISATRTSYDSVNKLLRNRPARLNPRAKAIQKAAQDAPTPPPPEVVWRGVQGDMMSDFKDGDIFRLNGFQSTTLDARYAARQGDTVLEIVPVRGVYVESISEFGFEAEFLIPHKAKYEIIGRKRVRIESKAGRQGRSGAQFFERDVIQVQMMP